MANETIHIPSMGMVLIIVPPAAATTNVETEFNNEMDAFELRLKPEHKLQQMDVFDPNDVAASPIYSLIMRYLRIKCHVRAYLIRTTGVDIFS